MSPLILNTVGVPLGLGLVLGLAHVSRSIPVWLQTLLTGIAILAVYTLLEGLPALPPVSAKQRLSYILLAAILLAVLADRATQPWLRRLQVPGFLLLALLWLGWAKVTQAATWPIGLLLFAPIVASTFSQPTDTNTRGSKAFLWPAALLVYAVNIAVLSLLGVFVGFAQVLGGFAALLGGALAVVYAASLIRREPHGLAPSVLRLVLMSFGAAALMVGLFAPDVSLLASAIAALVLCLPVIAPPLERLPDGLRPFVYGLMAAVPAALSIFAAARFGH